MTLSGADVAALIHTFPFIVQDMRDGTIGNEWATDRYYWTGVAALVPQVSRGSLSRLRTLIERRVRRLGSSSHPLAP